MFLDPALFFPWKCLFFGLRPIENRIFKENLCFFLLKMDFSMKVFVFLGLRPIENWFFNESVGFFWVQPLWKTVLCLFLNEFKVFLRPELIFQWESLFFWFQAYWKLIFRWESLFFWSKAYWKLIFQWESLFFWVSGLLKIHFSMRVFVS